MGVAVGSHCGRSDLLAVDLPGDRSIAAACAGIAGFIYAICLQAWEADFQRFRLQVDREGTNLCFIVPVGIHDPDPVFTAVGCILNRTGRIPKRLILRYSVSGLLGKGNGVVPRCVCRPYLSINGDLGDVMGCAVIDRIGLASCCAIVSGAVTGHIDCEVGWLNLDL